MSNVDKEEIKQEIKQEIKRLAKEKAEKAKLSAAQKKNLRASKNKPQIFKEPEQTGDLEKDLELEIDAIKKGFRERAKMENNRFDDVTDSEFWFAMCFKTREQKERFLKAMKWIEYGDKYLNGELIAAQMGVDIGESDLKMTAPKIDKDYAKLSL